MRSNNLPGTLSPGFLAVCIWKQPVPTYFLPLEHTGNIPLMDPDYIADRLKELRYIARDNSFFLKKNWRVQQPHVLRHPLPHSVPLSQLSFYYIVIDLIIFSISFAIILSLQSFFTNCCAFFPIRIRSFS